MASRQATLLFEATMEHHMTLVIFHSSAVVHNMVTSSASAWRGHHGQAASGYSTLRHFNLPRPLGPYIHQSLFPIPASGASCLTALYIKPSH